MKKIAVIGATGKLGKELMKHPHTVSVPWMFENQQETISKWFEDHPEIDTVWHVARTCRKVGKRRDHETFVTELTGMINLLQTRARECRFVYASSKILYGFGGLSHNKEEILPVDKVAKHFMDDKVGVFNCPEWQDTRRINVSDLDNERTIYANTKLANETMIMRWCTNFKIIRIWDIA
jgi:nucleoside-diphosphate-sugar epimerase|tara:strand:- start:352 stop:888 length:537 start_codon:yes stop_codon:yes gene_type:complete